jgi:hypothetical protein
MLFAVKERRGRAAQGDGGRLEVGMHSSPPSIPELAPTRRFRCLVAGGNQSRSGRSIAV